MWRYLVAECRIKLVLRIGFVRWSVELLPENGSVWRYLVAECRISKWFSKLAFVWWSVESNWLDIASVKVVLELASVLEYRVKFAQYTVCDRIDATLE